jgi:hypothetical protein
MDAAATMLAGRTMAATVAKTCRAATLALNAMIEPPRFRGTQDPANAGPTCWGRVLRGSLAGYCADAVMLRKMHTPAKAQRKRTDET